MAVKHASDTLLNLARGRRSHYVLTKALPAGVTNAHIQKVVQDSFLTTPSSFNSQPVRAVVLFGAEHDRLWDITSTTLKAIVPEDKWQPTADKLALFKGGAGTVLFFTEDNTTKKFQEQFATYADRFPHWAAQSAAMHQSLIWTALEADGLGANLQHYNPLIDDKVREAWKLPASWTLDAQLVFGGRTQDPEPKDKLPVDELVKAFGA